jgi:hypothetical protein
MNIRNLTLEEINTAPATKVAEWLAEYNKWRRGEPPYSWGGDKMPFTPSELGAIITRAVKLLAEPLRNCDVETADEQYARFVDFCWRYRTVSIGGNSSCNDCPIKGRKVCQLAWAQMPYESEVK